MKTGFQCYVHRTNVLKTYSNGHFEFQLPFWVYNQIYMKYILCQRRRVYAGKKEVFQFLNKHVKSETKGMSCGIYIV